MINRLVPVSESINYTVYYDNIETDSPNYARIFLLALAEMNHILNQLYNLIIKLEPDVSTIYKYIDHLDNKSVTSMIINAINLKIILNNMWKFC